jgi:hypothetical protein
MVGGSAAMTTCTPLKPFRCWQYREGAPVPEWAKRFFTMRKGLFDIGDWLVCAGVDIVWLTAVEFAERFKVIE